MSPLKHVLFPVLHCSDLDGNRILPEPFLVYGKYLQPEEYGTWLVGAENQAESFLLP